jgi:hypothetical protein
VSTVHRDGFRRPIKVDLFFGAMTNASDKSRKDASTRLWTLRARPSTDARKCKLEASTLTIPFSACSKVVRSFEDVALSKLLCPIKSNKECRDAHQADNM